MTRQREDCEAIARLRGWTVVDTYTDNDFSASSRSVVRPAYEAMVRDFKNGSFEAMVVWDLDRLTRQPRQLEDWIDAAEDRGLILVTANGEADLSTDGGRMYARIKAAVARAEIERRSARQKRANQQRLDSGQDLTGTRPFGFERDRMVLRELEAELIRAGYKIILSGGTVYAVTHLLNASGVLSTNGKTWTHTTARQVLQRPRNAGLLTSKGEIIGDTLTPIVSREDWEALCAILSDSKRRVPRGRKPAHQSAGLATCAVCHSPMRSAQVTLRGVPTPIYKCARKLQGLGLGEKHPTIQMSVLDPIVSTAIADVFLHGPAKATAQDDAPGRLDASLAQVRQRIKGVVSLVSDGTITDAEARDQIRELRQQEQSLETQRDGAARQSAAEAMRADLRGDLFTSGPVSITRTVAVRKALRERFDGLDIEKRRELIRTHLSIVVHPGRGIERVRVDRLDA